MILLPLIIGLIYFTALVVIQEYRLLTKELKKGIDESFGRVENVYVKFKYE